jgi:hypothetical protein
MIFLNLSVKLLQNTTNKEYTTSPTVHLAISVATNMI